MPFYDVTINNHITDPSAQKPSPSSYTPKPNKTTGTITNSTTVRTPIKTTTASTTAKPATFTMGNRATTANGNGINDLNTDSTNKRTTTATPNNNATKGYKLDNSTDDDVHATSIHPINVPTPTTEISIKNGDMVFDTINGGVQPVDVTFRPLFPITDNLIPNYSMVDPLLAENGTIPWPIQNVTVLCQINRDCPTHEYCIHGQCKSLCGPHNRDNCFSGISLQT